MGVWVGWRCVDSEMEEVSAGESDASSLKPVSSIASSSSLDTCCSLTPQGYPCKKSNLIKNMDDKDNKDNKDNKDIEDIKDKTDLKSVSFIASSCCFLAPGAT